MVRCGRHSARSPRASSDPSPDVIRVAVDPVGGLPRASPARAPVGSRFKRHFPIDIPYRVLSLKSGALERLLRLLLAAEERRMQHVPHRPGCPPRRPRAAFAGRSRARPFPMSAADRAPAAGRRSPARAPPANSSAVRLTPRPRPIAWISSSSQIAARSSSAPASSCSCTRTVRLRAVAHAHAPKGPVVAASRTAPEEGAVERRRGRCRAEEGGRSRSAPQRRDRHQAPRRR